MIRFLGGVQQDMKFSVKKKTWIVLVTLAVIMIGCSGNEEPKSIENEEKAGNSTVETIVDTSADGEMKQTENETNIEQTEETDTNTDNQEKKNNEKDSSTDENTSEDELLKDAKKAAKAGINSNNQKIKKVKLKKRDLCIYVDLSNTDPEPLTIEDVAWTLAGSITDEVLELEQYYSMWDTITVDFGEVGFIKNSKDEIQNDGYGNYFPAENFNLEKK